MRAMCEKLNIDPHRYSEMMFDMGEEYFKWRCDGFEKALQAFRTSREMWAWWKAQYIIIDRQLLTDAVNFNMEMYRAFHLGLEYFPHEAIVKKALGDYEKVAQGIIKESKDARPCVSTCQRPCVSTCQRPCVSTCQRPCVSTCQRPCVSTCQRPCVSTYQRPCDSVIND